MRNEEPPLRLWQRQWNRLTHGKTVRVDSSVNNKQIVGLIVGYTDWFIMSREQDETEHW